MELMKENKVPKRARVGHIFSATALSQDLITSWLSFELEFQIRVVNNWRGKKWRFNWFDESNSEDDFFDKQLNYISIVVRCENNLRMTLNWLSKKSV